MHDNTFFYKLLLKRHFLIVSGIYIRQYVNSSLRALTKMAKIGTWRIINNLQYYHKTDSKAIWTIYIYLTCSYSCVFILYHIDVLDSSSKSLLWWCIVILFCGFDVKSLKHKFMLCLKYVYDYNTNLRKMNEFMRQSALKFTKKLTSWD